MMCTITGGIKLPVAIASHCFKNRSMYKKMPRLCQIPSMAIKGLCIYMNKDIARLQYMIPMLIPNDPLRVKHAATAVTAAT